MIGIWMPFPRLVPAAAAFVFFVAMPVAGQPRGSDQAGPRHDPATEATISGTVQAVEQVAGTGAGRGRRGLGGTHLQLKTGTETVEVHLGPTDFLNRERVEIANGDRLDIQGSRVTVDGERVFLAKSLKKGNQVWTLRDTAGLPLWRQGRR